jgi:hypothetical protein
MLTAAQRLIHDRYTAIGFTITDRPFAGTDRTKWYFATRPDSDERRTDFSINLDSAICHQMGTNQLRTIDQAEAEYSGERQGVSPPSAIQSVPRPATRKPESRPTEKKKQAALF